MLCPIGTTDHRYDNFGRETNKYYFVVGADTPSYAVSYGYNQLDQVTNVFIPGQLREDFVYDSLGRCRIVREYAWDSGWQETNEIQYIYDGYLPIQERDSNNDVLVTYTRGLDLSDSMQGAGGIGRLLARTDANGSTYYHHAGARAESAVGCDVTGHFKTSQPGVESKPANFSQGYDYDFVAFGFATSSPAKYMSHQTAMPRVPSLSICFGINQGPPWPTDNQYEIISILQPSARSFSTESTFPSKVARIRSI